MPDAIKIIDTGYETYDYEQSLLEKEGYELQIFSGDHADRDGKRAFAADAVGLFVRWTIIDRAFLRHCPRLKVIVRYGTGYENIDLEAAAACGIKVANVTGYGNHSVSDHALALVYACARGLFHGAKSFKTHFGKPPFPAIPELHRKTLGIIGLGRIGGTLATKAVHLFQKVLGYDPYIPDARFGKLGVDKAGFEHLLKGSDVISLHCNLTDETRHMINDKAFRSMKKKPVLINTSRGPVVDTGALLHALESAQIRAAGLDVFNAELPGEIPDALLHHPDVIATGHYAWYSENSVEDLQRRATHNMLHLLTGKQCEDALI